MWSLLGFLGVEQRKVTVMYPNNQSIIAFMESGQTSCKAKHIKVCFHYTRHKTADGTIRLEYCTTNKMIVNKLIKVLAPELFVRLRDKFMASKSIAYALGGSVCTTMQQQPMGRHPVGASWPVD